MRENYHDSYASVRVFSGMLIAILMSLCASAIIVAATIKLIMWIL